MQNFYEKLQIVVSFLTFISSAGFLQLPSSLCSRSYAFLSRCPSVNSFNITVTWSYLTLDEQASIVRPIGNVQTTILIFLRLLRDPPSVPVPSLSRYFSFGDFLTGLISARYYPIAGRCRTLQRSWDLDDNLRTLIISRDTLERLSGLPMAKGPLLSSEGPPCRLRSCRMAGLRVQLTIEIRMKDTHCQQWADCLIMHLAGIDRARSWVYVFF